MPNSVSGTEEKGDGDEAEKQREVGKDFDLNKVRERLAAVRAAGAQRELLQGARSIDSRGIKTRYPAAAPSWPA